MADVSACKLHVKTNAVRAMEYATVRSRVETQRAAPFSKGDLYDSIQETRPSGGMILRAAIFSMSKVALFMDKGTKPHKIRPRGSGYPLKFYWPLPKGPNATVRFMEVNHPGTAARNFFSRPMRERFHRNLQSAIDRLT